MSNVHVQISDYVMCGNTNDRGSLVPAKFGRNVDKALHLIFGHSNDLDTMITKSCPVSPHEFVLSAYEQQTAGQKKRFCRGGVQSDESGNSSPLEVVYDVNALLPVVEGCKVIVTLHCTAILEENASELSYSHVSSFKSECGVYEARLLAFLELKRSHQSSEMGRDGKFGPPSITSLASMLS